MLPISAPFPVGFGGSITPPPPPANAVPGQSAAAFPGVPPASQNANQTNSAVPPTGTADRPDTDAQGNNTETPTRGEYGESGSDEGGSKYGARPQQQLNQEEQAEVQELSARDREVRAHEAAHLAAAGRYATGGVNLDYERGPDGRQYAVGGEVGIDTSEIANDPEATLRKAQTIRAAAMAPAEPSAQDRRVAVEAARLAARARLEILEQRQREQGYPEGYKPPAIRAYDEMAGYFGRMGNSGEPISVHA